MFWQIPSTLNQDLIAGLKMWRVIRLIAITDMIARYRRTLLGPLWIVIGLAFGSLGLGLLWSELWGIPKEDIVPSITVGFLVWIFLNNCVMEGTNCFLVDSSMLQNMSLPITFLPLLCLSKQLINFLHSLLIIVAVSIIYPPDNLYMPLLAIPGILLLSAFLLITICLLGMLCARFRDISPLISSLMPMLFFLSPVLFRIQQAESISWLIWLNPFTYFIVIVREPLQGHSPSAFVVVAAVVITTACYFALATLMTKKRNQLVYWL